MAVMWVVLWEKAAGEDDSAIEAEGVVLDRNSLLDSVLNNKTPDK